MEFHMSNEHPTDLPIYCVRAEIDPVVSTGCLKISVIVLTPNILLGRSTEIFVVRMIAQIFKNTDKNEISIKIR
jgi:hypothetical protein